MLGEELGLRRGEDDLMRKQNVTFPEAKSIRRGSSSLFQEEKKTHFETNSLTDRSINKVSEAA